MWHTNEGFSSAHARTPLTCSITVHDMWQVAMTERYAFALPVAVPDHPH